VEVDGHDVEVLVVAARVGGHAHHLVEQGRLHAPVNHSWGAAEVFGGRVTGLHRALARAQEAQLEAPLVVRAAAEAAVLRIVPYDEIVHRERGR
jgi:hypothetical protein